MTALDELISRPTVSLLANAFLSAVLGVCIAWAGRKLLNAISTKFRERRAKQEQLLKIMTEVFESVPLAVVVMSTTIHFDRIGAHLLAVEAMIAFVFTVVVALAVPIQFRNTIFFVLLGIVWAACGVLLFKAFSDFLDSRKYWKAALVLIANYFQRTLSTKRGPGNKNAK